MDKKNCLITGASSGLGFAAAMQLAGMNYRMILVSRDPKRGESAARQIQAQSGNSDIDYFSADLSSIKEIRALTNRIRSKYQTLDVLINNAGGLNHSRKTTCDQLEMTFAVNHLSYFMITLLLLDLLKSVPSARVINTASKSHMRKWVRAALNFNDLQFVKGYSAFGAYGQSKLANVMFTYELARRLRGTQITVNCLHPGLTFTGLGQSDVSWISIGLKLASPFLLKPEKACQGTVYLASSPEVAGVSGKYFVDGKPVPSSKDSYSEDAWRRLWNVSTKLAMLSPQEALDQAPAIS